MSFSKQILKEQCFPNAKVIEITDSVEAKELMYCKSSYCFERGTVLHYSCGWTKLAVFPPRNSNDQEIVLVCRNEIL